MEKKLLLIIMFLLGFSSNSQNVNVITYNIRLDLASDAENAWPNRKEYLCNQILFYEPDILGIQEAKPNQVVDINNKLSQYANIGIGREGIEKGESSNIYYKKNRFTVKAEATFWLSETPNEISKGWDAAFNRVCTYALFKDNLTKKQFWIFNTHLDHIGEEARTKGITLILSKIKEVNTKNYPVIFMGDFNSEPNSDRIISLKKQMDDSRIISKQEPFGPSGTFNGFNHTEIFPKLIDYIFLSKNDFEVLKYAILTDSKDLKYPSDHFPVFIKVNLL